MEMYPLNLILAVAAASATIFLGFLPTRTIRIGFFVQETLKVAIAWALVGMMSQGRVAFYHVGIAILCFGACWKFRGEHVLSGKMWLSIGSGLGISVGVMLLLAVTPQAFPEAVTGLTGRCSSPRSTSAAV